MSNELVTKLAEIALRGHGGSVGKDADRVAHHVV